MPDRKFEKLIQGQEISEEAQKGFQGLMAVGEDEFGLFACTLSVCPHCNADNQLCVFWNVHPDLADNLKFHLPNGIDRKKTPSLILSKGEPPRIGFTCGCYAKLHRQVAHIKDSIQRRQNAARRTRDSRKRRK